MGHNEKSRDIMKVKHLKDWENELNICIRCAYCFEGCPVFKELGWESDGARGKAVLSYGLLSGELKPSQQISDKIFQCSFCRDCVERCSANVSIPDILTAARADLVKEGFIYEEHEELIDKIKRTGNIFGKEIKPPVQDGETPVLLGCRLLERTDDAKKYIEILKKLGVKPKVIDEICCGMPFGVLGYQKDFEAYQKRFRKQFPYKDFICLCTTCAFFIKKAYTDLNPKYVIQEIAERLPNYNSKQLGIKVTYHDPCNLARGMSMVDEPREILKQIGVKVIEISTNGKQAECCGGGGGLLATDDTLAEKLAEKRVNQALDTGVDTLVTLCPTCEYNLGRAVDRNNGGLKVENVLDLVWEALR